jgi:hypothetical protein
MENLNVEQESSSENLTKAERVAAILRSIMDKLNPHSMGKNLSKAPTRYL